MKIKTTNKNKKESLKVKKISLLVAIVIFTFACETEKQQEVTKEVKLQKQTAAVCEKVIPSMMMILDTSARMNEDMGVEFEDGFDKPSEKSRWHVVKKTIKISMPHFKNDIAFGVMPINTQSTFEGGPHDDPPVDPCETAEILESVGTPYGQIVSSLEHVTPTGSAPITEALYVARNHISSMGDVDYKTIVIFTEGGDTCDGDTYSAITQLVNEGYDIRIVAIADTAETAQLNTLALITGNAVTLLNSSERLDEVFSLVSADANAETCDGIDNDCDGQIDENLIRGCAEECGGGVQYCADGEWGRCVDPETVPEGEIPDVANELCDSIDNDCDGETDEDFELGGLCFKTYGVCENSGQYACSPDHLSVVCDAADPESAEEICDGIDNNCNGLVDEELSQECSDGCGTGTRSCDSGEWGTCEITIPNPEICDGIDNNCDGQTDEGFELGIACVACGVSGTMVCSDDHLTTVCSSLPEELGTEICDGIDNDCDGLVDEGSSICSDGKVCFAGQCIYD